MSEIYYSIALPGKSVKSKFKIALGNEDLASTISTGDIELSDNKFISTEKLDKIFVKALYSHDFMEISDFLDFHLTEYNGDDVQFLKRIKYVIDQYFAHESIIYFREDKSIQPHINNPKTREIYNWLEKHNQEYNITDDKTKPAKLKWLGTPSQFGWVFLELADKGFIEIPKTGGINSYSKFAAYCYDLFDLNTTHKNLVKEMNRRSNSLTDANMDAFTIPEISDLSKSK